MTQGEFVSEVRHHLKALTKDEFTSARYILATAKSYVKYLVSNRAQSNIYRDVSNFVYVPCVELSRESKISCDIVEFKQCDKIMKSKKVLPEIYSMNSGPIIESITNFDNSVKYERLASLADYTKTKKRKFAKSATYYTMANKYLYILGSTTEIVNINFLPEDEREAKQLSSCNKCDDCSSALENKFVCPTKWLSTVRDQTVQLIASINKAIPEDEKPDLDSNQK